MESTINTEKSVSSRSFIIGIILYTSCAEYTAVRAQSTESGYEAPAQCGMLVHSTLPFSICLWFTLQSGTVQHSSI